jgi:phosphate/sulfate permease
MAAALSQYDYIFAITVVFAFLDAWNIGTTGSSSGAVCSVGTYV